MIRGLQDRSAAGRATLTASPPAHAGAPGKRTLTEAIAAEPPGPARASAAPLRPSAPGTQAPPSPTRPTIQALFGSRQAHVVQRAGETGEPRGDAIHAAAGRGIATPATQLPHGDAIQRAFGRHDISSVQAHVGGEAAASARAIGAAAYATGHHVVAGDNPDLFTMAHEAAHIIQQRTGARPAGGVGQAGDRYEQHADAVAARVVRGESAESLLDEMTGDRRSVDGDAPDRGAGAGVGAVQRLLIVDGHAISELDVHDILLLQLQSGELDPTRFDADARYEGARDEHDEAARHENEHENPRENEPREKEREDEPRDKEREKGGEQEYEKDPRDKENAKEPPETAGQQAGERDKGKAEEPRDKGTDRERDDANDKQKQKEPRDKGKAKEPRERASGNAKDREKEKERENGSDDEQGAADRVTELPPHLAEACERLQFEAGNSTKRHRYADWTAALHRIEQLDPQQIQSSSVTRGNIVFTNVAKPYHGRAEQVLELLIKHPSITRFLRGRPCRITLVNTPGTPASVLDVGAQVNVDLAYWYFETYELGYILGMLCHEFAIHPMASQDPEVEEEEDLRHGEEIPTGVERRGMFGSGGGMHTVNHRRAVQSDHIFGAVEGPKRNAIYRQAVIEMAQVLLDAAPPSDSTAAEAEVGNLIDCFLMDCASILATDDHRDRGPQNVGLLVRIYDHYLERLSARVRPEMRAVFPGRTSRLGVANKYATIAFRLAKGQMLAASIDRVAYQPTQAQDQQLESTGLYLRWIEPDGRGVAGAIGYLTDQSSSTVIAKLLDAIEHRHQGVRRLIEADGLECDEVAEAIRTCDPRVEHWDRLMTELFAVSEGIAITVLHPDGKTEDFLGRGPTVVRVMNPRAHYHATTRDTLHDSAGPAISSSGSM